MNQSQTTQIVKARVCQVQKGRYQILLNGQERWAHLKTAQFYQGKSAVEYPAVGDWAEVYDNPAGEAVITRILPRHSSFERFNPGYEGVSHAGKQVVAANFDLVFLTESLNQNFNLRRMERYLAAAWNSGAVPVILLTKADLCPQWQEKAAEMMRIAPGVDVLAVSVVSGQGLKELKAYMKEGVTAVFLGSSGVGKSSLVNVLAGREWMRTQEIREQDGKGRHTTTYRQLIPLPGGAVVIDTPGMRTLSLLDVEKGVAGIFEDVEQLAQQCKFRDCRHEGEPGCAVRQAVEEGKIPAERLCSYQKLMREAKYQAIKAKRQERRIGGRRTGIKKNEKYI